MRAFGLEQLDLERERPQADGMLRRWAVELTASIGAHIDGPDEPLADRRLRTELGNLREAWRSARVCGDRDLGVELLSPIYFASKMRDLIEVLGWARELGADPVSGDDPRWATCLAMAADAASVMGDHEEAEHLVRSSLEFAKDDDDAGRRVVRNFVRSSVWLLRGEFARARTVPVDCRDGGPLGLSAVSAALAAVYADDLPDRALLGGLRARSSPTRQAWSEYIAGEIDGLANSWDAAEMHYRAAARLAQVGGATFLEGVASVGLASVQSARGDAHDALLAYRDLLAYWERTASWTFQTTTLRNLAGLLEALGAREASESLHAAVGQPSESRTTAAEHRDARTTPSLGDSGRANIIEIARQAIDELLPARAR